MKMKQNADGLTEEGPRAVLARAGVVPTTGKAGQHEEGLRYRLAWELGSESLVQILGAPGLVQKEQVGVVLDLASSKRSKRVIIY
jgi:hypothetical protein